MEPRKLFNSDQIGLSNYNKMEEETSIQGDLNNLSQSTNRLNINEDEPLKKSRCLSPHKWRLDECCCGCTLRVATLLIGWCYLIGSSLLLFGFAFIPGPNFYRWEDAIFTSVKLISSLILLVGVYKEIYLAIRGAAVLYLLDLLVEIILGIILTFQIGEFFPIMILLFGLPLGIYFLVVVNSFASEVASGNVKKRDSNYIV